MRTLAAGATPVSRPSARRPHRARWTWPGIAWLLTIGCVHRVAPDEEVLHVREIVGVRAEGERSRILVAELAASDGMKPRVTVSEVRLAGIGRVIGTLHEGDAAAVAAGVRAGGSLRGAFCQAGLAPEPSHPIDCDGGFHGGRSLGFSDALFGWRLELRRDDHPKWGEAWAVFVRDGQGREREVLRTTAREASLVAIGADGAAVVARSRDGGFHTADVLPIDPRAEAALLLAGAGVEAIERGDDDDAR
ncbi:MAG TPA: hypothetical protein VGD74_13235, partial [Vulgatibacter sp.]